MSIIWIKNNEYDWNYIQELRITADRKISQADADEETRSLAQAVLTLTELLQVREGRIPKALSKRRSEPNC